MKILKILKILKTLKILALLVSSLFLMSAGYAEDSGLLWLVNLKNTLEATYRPQKLININGYQMHPEAGEAFLKMLDAMEVDGIENLRMCSAYRPYRYQKALFDEKKRLLCGLGYDKEEAERIAARSVAVPGASEHQLGLAVDVSVTGRLNVHFGTTEAGIWLAGNCHKYGYIIRYPKDKTEITKIIYEPWHLRYVGVPHAGFMKELDLCLEEYIDFVKDAGILLYWLDDERYYKVSYCPGDVPRLQPVSENFSISSIGPRDSAGYIITELKQTYTT